MEIHFLILMVSLYPINPSFADSASQIETKCLSSDVKIVLSCSPTGRIIISDVFYGKTRSANNICQEQTPDLGCSASDCGIWESSRSSAYNKKCMGKTSCEKLIERSETFECGTTVVSHVNSCYTSVMYKCVSETQIMLPKKSDKYGEDIYIKLSCNGNKNHCHWIIKKQDNSGDISISVIGPKLKEDCKKFSIKDGKSVIKLSGRVNDDQSRNVTFQTKLDTVIITSVDETTSPNCSVWVQLRGANYHVQYEETQYTGTLPSASSTGETYTTTISEPGDENENNNDDSPIIGGVVGGLLFVIIIAVIAAVFIYRRRKKILQPTVKYSDVERNNQTKAGEERSYDKIPKTVPSGDSHNLKQGSHDDNKGYKISIPGEYSYTKVQKMLPNDEDPASNAFTLKESNKSSNIEDSSNNYYVVEGGSSDYVLARAMDAAQTPNTVEQDHYGYSHMPGLEKRSKPCDNDDYGRIIDNQTSKKEYDDYSHMEEHFKTRDSDGDTHYNHSLVDSKGIDHDNYGYAHMNNC